MKMIVAGSRNIDQYSIVYDAICRGLVHLGIHFGARDMQITELVSGGARGVDELGERWAAANGIPVKKFIPDWRLGRGAGQIRNKEMAEYADILIAIWDGESRGTKGMIDYAKKAGLKVFVYKIGEEQMELI